MKFKPKVKVTLGTCSTCRKPIGNPFTHTCVIKLDQKARGAAKKKGGKKPTPKKKK